MRKIAALALVCTALAGGVSACSVAGHKVPSSVTQSVWCTYHLWRLERDVRHRHLGWGVFQTVLAVHHCGRVARSVVGL